MDYPNRSLNLVPKQVALLRVRMLRLFGRVVDAESSLETALRRWPQDDSVLRFALNFYASMQNWNRYFEACAQMDILYPNNVGFKRDYGTSLLSSYRYAEAAHQFELCRDLWNLGPAYDTAWANMMGRLGICYAYLGQWDSYTAAVAQAEKISPWDPEVIYGRLLFYAGAGNLEALATYLSQKIDLSPGFYALYYWMGLYQYHYLQDPLEATRWYRLSLQRLDSFRWFLKNRRYWKDFYAPIQYANPFHVVRSALEAHAELGEFQKARQVLRWSRVAIWHKDIDAMNLQHSLDIGAALYIKAEQDCIRSLNGSPRLAQAPYQWYYLARAQSELGKYDDAADSIQNTLKMDPGIYEAWKAYADILLKRGEWSLAQIISENIVGMNRFDSGAWRLLGDANLGEGKWESSRIAYEESVRLNPSQALVWFKLAQVHERLHQRELAAAAYATSLRHGKTDSAERTNATQALARLRSG